ncbi:MAG: PAS domain-containing sensor histidine kinase, partial [Mannheimia varigena]|nr:PAS domain-containing sensor histidine kinase [Mannheimia varigena]
MMKKLLNFLAELILSITLAFTFSLFALDFMSWLAVISIGVIVWHHIIEYRLLQRLNPQNKKEIELLNLENFSQTMADYRQKNKKEKFENLRLLSKLNKNIQYLPDATIICQDNGDILWCNQMAQKMFDFYWHKKTQKNILNV